MPVTIQTTANLQPAVMVTIDASTSFDTDGEIVSWRLNFGGTVTPPDPVPAGQWPGPPTITGGKDYLFTAPQVPIATHLWIGPSPIIVTLVVTDSQGLTAYNSNTVPFDVETLPKEMLVSAEGNAGALTVDGEKTWRVSADIAATMVAPVTTGGVVLYAVGGVVYATADALATDPILLHTFASTVTALWNNEAYANRWLAGLENGEIWLSVDNGQTWVEPNKRLEGHPLPWGATRINDLSESPFSVTEATSIESHATAAVGNNLWRTFNLLDWLTVITHNAPCYRFAAGAFATDPGATTIISKVYGGFADGVVKRWSDTGGEGTTDIIAGAGAIAGEIRGLTLAIAEEIAYIFTSAVGSPNGFATYTWRPGGTLTPGAVVPTSVNYAIRSFNGPWVYLATDGAIGKWVPDGGYYDIRILTSPARGLRVGYGSEGLPPPEGSPLGVWRSNENQVFHGIGVLGWDTFGNLGAIKGDIFNILIAVSTTTNTVPPEPTPPAGWPFVSVYTAAATNRRISLFSMRIPEADLTFPATFTLPTGATHMTWQFAYGRSGATTWATNQGNRISQVAGKQSSGTWVPMGRVQGTHRMIMFWLSMGAPITSTAHTSGSGSPWVVVPTPGGDSTLDLLAEHRDLNTFGTTATTGGTQMPLQGDAPMTTGIAMSFTTDEAP